jgi:hypothetical protein
MALPVDISSRFNQSAGTLLLKVHSSSTPPMKDEKLRRWWWWCTFNFEGLNSKAKTGECDNAKGNMKLN